MSEPKRILYRGVPMIEGWPEKIFAAQQSPSYAVQGRDVGRVRYGDEHDDWGADQQACHDCRVIKGEFHVPGCDVERCPICGGQVITCDCPFDESDQVLINAVTGQVESIPKQMSGNATNQSWATALSVLTVPFVAVP